MKTKLRTMAVALRAVSLLLVMNLVLSCSNNKSTESTTQNTTVPEKNSDTITIQGIVEMITFGKDGYMAEVPTDSTGVYAALVSIVNVGGQDNYKSCEVGDRVVFKGVASVLGGMKQLKVTEIINITATSTQLLISPLSFRGIRIGDTIAKHGDYIKKTKLKTGEGTFDVYEIKDFENNPAGYFLPDPKDKLLVGDITVKTPKAQTVKGIKVGDTFQDLLKVFPDIAVNGSEIEGRTHATIHNLSYRLDVANFKYDIDKTTIPTAAKIKEIIINRRATNK